MTKKLIAIVFTACIGTFFMPSAAAETYYMHGFFGLATIEPTTGPNVIEYPNTDWYWGRGIRQGETNLDNQIGSLPPGSTVMGISEGSIVVRNWLRDHASDPDAPDDVKFVLAAPPLLPGGLIYTVLPEGTWLPIAEQTIEPMPVTPYDIDVVRMEYDGWADFPTYWYVNPLADANAIVGMFYQAHGATPVNDYKDTPHYSTTNELGGTTTNYLAPDPVLPITAPLRDVGVPPQLVDAVDNVLRPVIDMGYDRSAYTNTAEVTNVAAQTSTSTISSPSSPIVKSDSPTKAVRTHRNTSDQDKPVTRLKTTTTNEKHNSDHLNRSEHKRQK